MADHDLIHNYLDELGRLLPATAVEELADGLDETFQHHLRRGLSPADAAQSAINDFGGPTEVTTAFARQSPGRRTAVALLITAPIFAVLWATTLTTAQAWTWQIPPGAAAFYGAVLLAVAATLLTVAKSNTPGTGRLAAPASIVLILLDLGMLAVIATTATAVTWPMAFAVPASLARTALTARNLPRLLA
ncbi:permease prefix domain 1-containing protein [Kribbella sp. DT2]|uniref:permease prefix domain 1-containing protein n=1 Tax=Kribbella sp. DT2 TaxID=3393427 RepID=UPI003CF7F00B